MDDTYADDGYIFPSFFLLSYYELSVLVYVCMCVYIFGDGCSVSIL